MDPFQLFAAGVALGHAFLLAGVYFGSSIGTHAFVSTEVHGMLFFKILLSSVVVLEHAFCATYIYIQGGSELRQAFGLLSVAAATTGWCVLAAFPTEDAAHMVGAVIFIAATGVYSFLFISKASLFRLLFYLSGATTLAAALIFVGFYFGQMYYEAAAAEWLAFFLNALLLTGFFLTNGPNQFPTRKLQSRAEFIVPLLEPIEF